MKGICYKLYLFTKVVDRTKTETRRIVPESIMDKYYSYDDWANSVGGAGVPTTRMYEKEFLLQHSRYKEGEIIYLKEPYYTIHKEESPMSKEDQYLYSFGWNLNISPIWSNKLFMPASAARYFQKIKSVRVERLQDISDEDCFKEGIFESRADDPSRGLFFNGSPRGIGFLTPRDAYAALIDKINGKGTWDSNPWMYVYDTELVDKPINL